MALTRRQLLGLSLGSAAALAGVTYLRDESMSPAPIREGKVLCDFHAHPCKNNDLDDLVARLGTPGLVGLAGGSFLINIQNEFSK